MSRSCSDEMCITNPMLPLCSKTLAKVNLPPEASWSQETRLLRERGQSPNCGAGLRHMDQWLAQRRGDVRPGRPGINDNMWISGQVPPVENLPFNYGRLPSPREIDRARRGGPPIEYIPRPPVPPNMENVTTYPPPEVGSVQRYRASRRTVDRLVAPAFSRHGQQG